MNSTRPTLAAALAALALLAACGGALPEETAAAEDDLGAVGDVQGGGNWGAATTCKALPTGLPTLKDPALVVSLDGLTVHLWDRQGTFDKVYPIGPGAIENGVSLSPIGHFTTGPADTTGGATDNGKIVGASPWAWWYRCKIWWTDPDTKKLTPVYGGLPLIRLKGPPTLAYALHGPVDSYGNAQGGSLRRAFVSHGCIRMRAQDISEVFVLLLGHGNVPVTIQRAVERTADDKPVDLAQRFVGSACSADSDCNFAGGKCHANAYGPSFCTAACNGSCADLPGEIATSCVADPSGGGMCVRQGSSLNDNCRAYAGFRFAPGTPRFGRAARVDACLPGSYGFVGDACLASADCSGGRTCERHGAAGLCTQPCTSDASCPTELGLASVCAQGRCLRACDRQDACGSAAVATCAHGDDKLACLPE